MSTVGHKFKKLRRLDFDEVRVRGAQKLSALAERHGWSSLGHLPTDNAFLKLLDGTRQQADEYLEHFRSRTRPAFFAGFDNREATSRVLNSRWPLFAADLVKRADRITEGRFDLLGLEQLSFGNPIDWHLEPIAGKRAPLVHWSRVDELDAERSGDKKILWELNRHQHFVILGQAYWLTNDERYAKAFVSQLSSWMDQNPPKLGIHWTSSLEIAFRSISWLWSFYFFRESPSFSPQLLWRVLKFLYLNARHLETYLSTYFSPNTHLTGEALGLFYLGTLLPEFREAERWKDTGRRILLDQLPIHVRPDGVYFEQSSYYHRYTTDFYAHFLLLSRTNGETLPGVEAKLQSLLDHLMYITRPDGTTPFFGDDDGGRLMVLDDRPANDFRAALSTGAAVFGRADYKFVAREAAQETLWLLGPNGLPQFDEILAAEPPQRSIAFADSGYYVMRDGWDREANYLLFDAGTHGVLNCGHAHADALSLELVARGRTELVDPGTYSYTGSREMRDWFRSSAAHNTLTIDGESSSVPDNTFSCKTTADAQCSQWISRDRFDFVTGTHEGYKRLADPVEHSRSILFLHQDYWVIRDQLRSEREHRADLWFHFEAGTAPLIEAEEGAPVTLGEHSGETGLDIVSFGQNGNWRREEGWVSHWYGSREPARLYVFSGKTTKDDQFVTFLLPAGHASERKA
ncbi:MAG TPA: alginate lyase family protein, partial [Pyrinomonadaceae bacterium]|nr:alginate lyase family protein [Pyrinomonadaceae bacterium]